MDFKGFFRDWLMILNIVAVCIAILYGFIKLVKWSVENNYSNWLLLIVVLIITGFMSFLNNSNGKW